jgi:PST family polysaccharide transporter
LLTSSLYWLNLGLALLLALLLAALAQPIALAYGEPRLAPVLAILALVFPLSGLAAVQQALLERAARFRLLARIEALSACCGVAVALAAATGGAGLWSLVLQMLATTGLTSLQLLHAQPWRPRRRFSWRALRQVLDFSGHFALFQLLNYGQRNADSVLIGRLLGPALLGLYAMAFKLILFPLQHISGIASRALVPAMSRCQHQPERLAELYLRASGMMALLTAPLMAGLYALREPFVLLVLGPAWSALIALVPWLAALGLIQGQAAVPGSVLLARGRARRMLWLGLLSTALQLAGLAAALRWGLPGMAAAYCLTSLLALLPLSWGALDGLPLRARALLLEVGKPVAAALVMLLAVAALHARLAASGAGTAAAFWPCLPAGALVYVLMLRLLCVSQLQRWRTAPGVWP